jgi:hypothetical protein
MTSVRLRINEEVYTFLQVKSIELSQEYLTDLRTGQFVIDPQTNQLRKF